VILTELEFPLPPQHHPPGDHPGRIGSKFDLGRQPQLPLAPGPRPPVHRHALPGVVPGVAARAEERNTLGAGHLPVGALGSGFCFPTIEDEWPRYSCRFLRRSVRGTQTRGVRPAILSARILSGKRNCCRLRSSPGMEQSGSVANRNGGAQSELTIHQG